MSGKRSINELLQDYYSKKDAVTRARQRQDASREKVRSALISGRELFGPVTTFEFLFEDEPDGTKGHKYLDLEASFQANAGEAILVVYEWSRPRTSFTHPNPDLLDNGISGRYYLGQIGLEPSLTWSEMGALKLPIPRLIRLIPNKETSHEDLREFESGDVFPSEIDEKITRECPDFVFNEDNLIIGTARVMSWFRERHVSDELLRNYFTAVGLENVNQEGEAPLKRSHGQDGVA